MLSVSNTNFERVSSVDAEANIHSCVGNDHPDVPSVSKDQKIDSCIINPANQYVCYKCDKSFSSNQEVIVHLKLIHNACAIRDCSKILDFKMHSSICVNRGFGCTICNKKFSEKHLLLMHFNEHIGAAFHVCDICRDGFQQRKDLQRHLLQIHQKNVCIPVIPSHSKAVYQKCSHCSRYYRLFAEFEEHSSSCCNSNVYACSICQIHFPTLSALDEHKFTEHKRNYALKGNLALKFGKRYFCGLCYMGFSKGSILKQHLETHEMEVSYICDVCHSRFTCDDELQTHYLLHIEEHYVLHDVISQHSCKSCKKTFKTQKELKNHMPNCVENLPVLPSGQVKASNCSSEELKEKNSNGVESAESFDTSHVLIYALKSGEDLLNCDDKQCVILMDLKSVFVFQRGICASESRIPDVVNSLAYDESDTIDASFLQTHMLQILSSCNDDVSISDNYTDSPIDTENHICVEQNFNTDSSTVERMTINFEESVDGSKIYYESLPENGDSTNRENAKEIYEVVTYEGTLNIAQLSSDNNNEGPSTNVINEESDVPYYNNDSNKCGINDEIINENLISGSIDEVLITDMHVCNICRQVFSSKTSLCLHMKGSHTGFDCYRCGNSFKSEDELKSHEKISHPRSFHCDTCKESYSKEHLLKKHKRNVHGGKHFMCNICGKSYVLKNEFDVHFMLHKGETPPTKCEFCGKIYASVGNYMRHKAIHEGKSLPKKYKCTVCDKGFIARSPLKRHLTTHIKKTSLTYECPKCKMYFPPKLLAKHVDSHNTSS